MDGTYSKRFYIAWPLIVLGMTNTFSFIDAKYWTEYAEAGGAGGFPVFALLACLVAPILSVIIHIIYVIVRRIVTKEIPRMHSSPNSLYN